jgi:hypothetical protein
MHGMLRSTTYTLVALVEDILVMQYLLVVLPHSTAAEDVDT